MFYPHDAGVLNLLDKSSSCSAMTDGCLCCGPLRSALQCFLGWGAGGVGGVNGGNFLRISFCHQEIHFGQLQHCSMACLRAGVVPSKWSALVPS